MVRPFSPECVILFGFTENPAKAIHLALPCAMRHAPCAMSMLFIMHRRGSMAMLSKQWPMLNAILNELNVAVFIIDDGSTEQRFNPEFAILWIYRRIPPRHSSCAAMSHATCTMRMQFIMRCR